MNLNHRMEQLRHSAIKAITISIVIFFVWLLADMVRQRLEQMGIHTGFDFLQNRAGYDLSESLINYNGDDSYGRALLAGFSNTLKVAFSSIFAAIAIGLLAASAMLSGHPTANRVARLYIRIVRNTPLLLQLFFWFGLFTISLPSMRERITLMPGVYLSNRGLNFPLPDLAIWLGFAFSLVVLTALVLFRARLKVSSHGSNALTLAAYLLVLGTVPFLLVAGFGEFDMPATGRFAIKGGGVLTPEFLTLFIGLSIYTGTYIAETLRGAVQAVARGQNEAGASLGLTRAQAFRLVVLPQATRIALPSIVSEVLNLIKNSSLGVAVGYPDLVSVGNTAMNQTGQAIEMIAIYMVAYVTINVVITKLSKLMEARYAW